MLQIGPTVLFHLEGEFLTLKCTGDFASQETTLQMDLSGEVEEEQLVIDNSYLLRFLTLFAKASSTCLVVQLFLRQSFPLVVTYSVANLGRLRFLLAPKAAET
jgi:proliferating cell nuclear antigen